jgi:hypothetical protein
VNRHVSVRFRLLDQQMVDAEDRPVGRVDDLELAVPGDGGPPVVTHVLTGAEALGTRLGGATGALMARTAARMRTADRVPGPARIPVAEITDARDLVKLGKPLRELAGIAGLERWLARRLVERIPGAGDAHL